MNRLDVFGAVVSPSSSHAFGLDVCELKHKVASWQGYGLDRSCRVAMSVSSRAKCLNHGLRVPPGSPAIDLK
jgi:hypothetical protein